MAYDEPRTKTEADDILLLKLAVRAGKLAEYAAKMRAVDTFVAPLVAIMGGAVIRTLIALAEDDVRREFVGWIVDRTKRGAGVCEVCGVRAARVPDASVAAALHPVLDSAVDGLRVECAEAVLATEREIDTARAFAEAPKGRPT